jgi:arylsulfatase A-like enzyme
MDLAPIRRSAFIGACIGATEGASIAQGSSFAQTPLGALGLVLVAAACSALAAAALGAILYRAAVTVCGASKGWWEAVGVAAVVALYVFGPGELFGSPRSIVLFSVGLGLSACWAWLEQHRPAWALAAAVVAFGLPVGLATSAGWAVPVLTPAKGASVLLVTVDGLRRDRLGVYSNSALTPEIDRFAEQALVFGDAVSPSSDPLAAHTALLAGIHPLRSGVIGQGDTLPPPMQPLARLLYQAGWSTGAFVSSEALLAGSGLERGFEVYQDELYFGTYGMRRIRWLHDATLVLRPVWRWREGWRRRDGWATVGAFQQWITRQQGPFFAWVHLDEPLAPLQPHGLRGFEGNGTPSRPAVDHAELLSHQRRPNAPETARLLQVYDEEVAYVDALFGILVATIDALPPDREVVVVLVGTSGSMLGEHRIFFESEGLYEELVRVPLLMRVPGRAPARIEEAVRLYDLAPTVLSAASLPNSNSWEGVNLLSEPFRGERSHLPAVIVGRSGESLRESPLIALRSEFRKTFVDLRAQEVWGNDRVEDPGEDQRILNPDFLAEDLEALRPDVLALRALTGLETGAR